MAKSPKQAVTATEIFDQIKASQDVRLTCWGFVRKTDSETEVELFCQSGWEKISTSIIDGVVYIDDDDLEGGEYPFVKIYLKEPETEEGKAFAVVARFIAAACEPPKPLVSNKVSLDERILPRFLRTEADFQSVLASACPGGMEYDRGKKCYYCLNDKQKRCVFWPGGRPGQR